MKKIFAIILIIVLSVCSIVISAADDNNETQINTTDIFGTNPIEEVNINLLNKDLYDESLAEYDFTGALAMQVYETILWEDAYKNVDELIAQESTRDEKQYIVIGDNLFVRLCESTKDGSIIISLIEDYDVIPNYWQDFINIETNHRLKSVFVFGGVLLLQSTAFYYVYEDETKVIYYEDRYTTAVEYSLEEFQQFAPDYYAYETSYERNYDENGHPRYGGSLSFASFLERYDYYMSQIGSYERNAQQRAKITYITIAATSFVLISGGIITVLLIRKKRGIK